jgi:hypothetical protein
MTVKKKTNTTVIDYAKRYPINAIFLPNNLF